MTNPYILSHTPTYHPDPVKLKAKDSLVAIKANFDAAYAWALMDQIKFMSEASWAGEIHRLSEFLDGINRDIRRLNGQVAA